MQDNFNIHSWKLKQAINELEQKQCPDCGCKMEGTMCNECGYMEEGATFTDKHDDNPKLKGDQKDLPDELQAKILNKEDVKYPLATLSDLISDLIKQGVSKEDIINVVRMSMGGLNEDIFNDIEDDLFHGTDSKRDAIEYLQEIIDFCEKKIADLETADLSENEDHEVSMAQNSLKSIISSASQLMSKLGDDERNIPGWIQDHITNAENYIDQANQGFHELEPAVKDIETTDIVAEDKYDIDAQSFGGTIKSDNPEGDALVLRFLKGIAKKFDYPVAQAALFVKERIKKLGY